MTNNESSIMDKIRIPGRRFRIPSRGLFYMDGEIDENVVNGELEIFPMTTIDEISLRSPEFLFTGEAIDRVFKRCIPEVNKPLRLLGRDVDFLLACLRVVSYGGTYQVNTRCPVCEEKQKRKNDLAVTEFLEEVRDKAKKQNISYEAAMTSSDVKTRLKTLRNKQSQEHSYDINLEGIIQNNTVNVDDDEFAKYSGTLSNGQRVQLTPLKLDSSVASYQFQNDEKTLNLDDMTDYVSFLLASAIVSVDDETNREKLTLWARGLPVKLKKELNEQLGDSVEWGTNFDYTVKCLNTKCNHERNISTLLNPITFFMTPSESVE